MPVRACVRACVFLRCSCVVVVLSFICVFFFTLFFFFFFFRTTGPRQAHHPVRRAFRPQQLVVRGRHHASLQTGGGYGQAGSGAQPHAGVCACVHACVRACVSACRFLPRGRLVRVWYRRPMWVLGDRPHLLLLSLSPTLTVKGMGGVMIDVWDWVSYGLAVRVL